MVMTTMAYEHKCLVTNSNLCLSLLLKAQAQAYGQVTCIFKYLNMKGREMLEQELNYFL